MAIEQKIVYERWNKRIQCPFCSIISLLKYDYFIPSTTGSEEPKIIGFYPACVHLVSVIPAIPGVLLIFEGEKKKNDQGAL